MVRKRKDEQASTTLTEPVTLEESEEAVNLKAGLEEIKGFTGVIGYILRNATSASIDLNDPTKIIDYAIISSTAINASTELSALFSIGDAKNIVVEGRNAKVLSLTIDENRISVFMNKDVDSEKILKRLLNPL